MNNTDRHINISIASDHAGFAMKEFLVQELRKTGMEVHDHGAHEFSPDDDFPEFISKVALDVSKAEEARSHDIPSNSPALGIVIGGSGQGEAMVANKYPYVRAAVIYGGKDVGGSHVLIEQIARLAKAHNDANIISLGARFLSHDEALHVVNVWLESKFLDDPKYTKRNNEIHDIESIYANI